MYAGFETFPSPILLYPLPMHTYRQTPSLNYPTTSLTRGHGETQPMLSQSTHKILRIMVCISTGSSGGYPITQAPAPPEYTK